MALNLLRDAKVYMSLVDTNGTWTAANTWELKVLDGFSFSQSTSTQEVTLNEAGAAPNRGQKIFNTALDPVDFSFSTYVRPYVNTTGASAGTGLVTYDAVTSNSASGLTTFTDYAFDLNVDSGGSVTISFNSGADVTMAGVVSSINEATTGVHVEFQTTQLVFISDTEGGSSAVVVATASTGTDLVATLSAGSAAYAAGVSGSASTTIHTAAEKILWEAITNGGATDRTDKMGVDFSKSNVHELPKYYLYVDVGNAVFEISEAIISSAEIDFSIDGIGMIAWTGQGSTYSVTSAPVAGTDYPNTGEYTAVPTNAGFLKNKLSTITMTGGPADGTYQLGLTAASITIDNGVTFLTPEELGEINRPIGHFTGTRAISGNFTCYLDTDANKSLTLLSDMLTDVVSANPAITNSFTITLNMGGENVPYVSFEMPRAHIVIPSIESEDVVSTSVDFTALGTGLTTTDEMTVSYYAKP